MHLASSREIPGLNPESRPIKQAPRRTGNRKGSHSTRGPITVPRTQKPGAGPQRSRGAGGPSGPRPWRPAVPKGYRVVDVRRREAALAAAGLFVTPPRALGPPPPPGRPPGPLGRATSHLHGARVSEGREVRAQPPPAPLPDAARARPRLRPATSLTRRPGPARPRPWPWPPPPAPARALTRDRVRSVMSCSKARVSSACRCVCRAIFSLNFRGLALPEPGEAAIARPGADRGETAGAGPAVRPTVRPAVSPQAVQAAA